MASNDLTPEKRINKHGVSVTKHVRQHPRQKNAKQLPAPAKEPAVSPAEKLLSQLEDILDDWGGKQETIDSLRETSRTNPRLFRDVITTMLAVSREERAVWRNAINKHEGNDEEMHYRRMLEVIPLSVPLYANAPPGYRYHKIRQRAEEAEQMYPCVPGYENYKRVKAGIILDEIGQKYVNYSDRDEFTTYLADNMDAVMPILPELVKRGDASAGLVRSLLENASPALNEGVL